MKKVSLLAFRGVGGFHNDSKRDVPGLIKAGHVGIQFEGSEIIWGFHPSPEAVEKAGGEENLLEALISYQRQAGTIQDDSAVFVDAHERSLQGERTTVFALILLVEDTKFVEMQQKLLEWHKVKHSFWYNLPKRDGSFAEDEYNCAVFPKLLDIDIPTNDGVLARYIASMIEKGATQWFPKVS